MNSEWTQTEWGELATLEYGKSLRNYGGSGLYQVFGTNGPIGWHSAYLFEGPSVVIGRKGAYRGVHYAPNPFFVIDTAFYLKPKKPFDMRWAYYQLLTQDINGMDSGSAIPSTSREAFYRLPVLVPPLEDQARIAGMLGAIDDKIQIDRLMCSTLEEVGRTIFRSWFVDFDPARAKVAAKAEGRDPERAAMAKISGKTEAELDALSPEQVTSLGANAALFPDHFGESAIGAIPAGWRLKPIGECAEIVGGGTPSTSDARYWDGEIAWATPKDMSRLTSPVLCDTERRITDAGLATISSGLLPPGTVLMSSRAPIGYLAITDIPVAINQGFIALKPTRGISSLFLLHWAKESMQKIKAHANGSTFLEISKSSFRPLPVVVPHEDLIEAYTELATPMYRAIINSERESRTLTAIRDRLLPRLLSGELMTKASQNA